MYKLKQLEWHKQENELEGVYAEPYGLKWRYSIIVHTYGSVEFAVLDTNFEYISGFPEFCKSVIEAKDKASKHYQSLIKQIVV